MASNDIQKYMILLQRYLCGLLTAKKIYTEHLLSSISGGTALAAGFTNGNKDNIKKWWSKLFLQN